MAAFEAGLRTGAAPRRAWLRRSLYGGEPRRLCCTNSADGNANRPTSRSESGGGSSGARIAGGPYPGSHVGSLWVTRRTRNARLGESTRAERHLLRVEP